MLRDYEYRPLSFWSFNGDMNYKDIEMQIKSFKAQGFGGFFMHARAGLKVKYLSDKWFAVCQKAIDIAKEEELDVWLYDEDGWPSGFGGGKVCDLGEKYQAKRLWFSKGQLPDDVKPLAAYRKHNASLVRISIGEAKPDDMLVGYKVLPNYSDLLDEKITAEFIKSVYEVYKEHFGTEFGKSIKGFFTDEPQLVESAPYSFRLKEEYEMRYGRDFLDDLGMMFVDDPEGDACRFRYWKCVSEMFVNSYTKQLSLWCEENNLEFTGHFAGEDGLCDQIAKSGDLLSHYTYMQRPGIDHLGNRLISSPAVKQVGDVAELCGRKFVLSESFGCSGWDVTFPQLSRIAAWQRMFGINCTTVHLSAFSLEGRRKRDYPAFFSEQEPWWNRFGSLASSISNDSSYTMAGESCDDILLLQPLSGIWSTLIPGIITERARDISAQFRITVEALIDAQLRFTIVNDNLLNRFNTLDGALCFEKRRFHRIIVAETTSLSSQTVELLEKFAKMGGEVIFINRRPDFIDGEKSFNCRWGFTIVNRRSMIEKYAQSIGYYNEIFVQEPSSGDCASDLVTRIRKFGNEYLIFVMQPELNCERTLELSVNGNHNISILNDGKENPLFTHLGNGKTRAKFNISYGQQIMFVTTPVKETSVLNIDLACEKRLNVALTYLDGENCLNIDRAIFRVGDKVLKTNNIVVANEIIYDIAAKNSDDTLVSVEYSFCVDFKGKLPEIFLLAESLKADSIYFNGVDITQKENSWEIDRSIRKYNITNYVKNGENKITLNATIKKDVFGGETADGKFETERNRFIYPIEFESVYLKGDFDVTALTETVDNRRFYCVDGGAENVFVLSDRTEKTSKDLTPQNLWFYTGNAEYETEVLYDGEEKAELCFVETAFSYAEVSIDGVNVGGVVSYPQKMDVTPYLSIGSNTVKIKIYGHYRNLLGPHHHIKGKVKLVGPDTFAGRKGWEDFVNPDMLDESTWTDDYNFVPFGLGKLYVRYFERSE